MNLFFCLDAWKKKKPRNSLLKVNQWCVFYRGSWQIVTGLSSTSGHEQISSSVIGRTSDSHLLGCVCAPLLWFGLTEAN